MKKFTILFSVLLITGILGFNRNSTAQIAKFCVIADVHYFDPDLLIQDGVAFQTYLAMDRKLIRESEAILESLVDSIIAIAPDFVLIPGDLTKDAAFTSHTKTAAFLQKLEDEGIEVYVCPGNHDVNNPHALAYDGDSVIPVPSVSPEQFDSIYANFGYDQALEKDPNSLSYLAEPMPGIQILSMDVCRYDSNYIHGHPETSGGFETETYNWAEQKVQEARENNKIIFGILHHNLLEHYIGQKAMFPEYVLDEWETVSTELADLGLKVVFTGHYHSQDVVMKTTDANNEIYDIETGSTVTWPCPYRTLEITNDSMLVITGDSIRAIDYDLGGVPFQTHAYNYLEAGLPLIVHYMLTSPPYNLDSATAAMATPAITETMIAHYHGDEGNPSPQTQVVIEMMVTLYPEMGLVLQGIWEDPDPGDWEVSIDLKSSSQGIPGYMNFGDVKVYPNPADDIINIALPEEGKNQNVVVSLYDQAGKKVLSKEYRSKEISISIGSLIPGFYNLNLKIGSVTLSKKIIVN